MYTVTDPVGKTYEDLINTAHEGICTFCIENMSEDEIDRVKKIEGLDLEF